MMEILPYPLCILAPQLDWSVMKLSAGKMGSQLEMVGTGVLTVLSRLPLSWSGVGAIVVGLLLARWTWILFAPNSFAVLPAKSDVAWNASDTLFGMPAVSGAAVASSDTESGNMHLVGIFTGSQGFAVFKIDEKTQRGVALGEEVFKGTKLTEVGTDYAVLEHNGISQRVKLESKASNKDSLVSEHSSAVSGVSQAVAGWNQANQEIQNKQKIPNAHRQ